MARAKLLLQEIETYAQNIGDTIRDPLIILDRDLCVKSANRAFYQTFQTLPEDTEDRPISKLGDGQWNIPPLLDLLRNILPTKGHFDDYEVTHDFPKIGTRTMLLNARKLYRPGNRTVLLVLAIEDITERKRTELALAESEEHFRTLYETMVQGVLYQNATGILISANPTAQRLLGLSIDKMAGRVSADPRWKAVHEDGTAFAGDDHPPMRALRTGQPVLGVVMGVFNPHLNEMRWLCMDSVPQFLPGEDRPYQVYSTFEDITERKQAAQAMVLSEQRYRRLFETAHDGILILDAEAGNIVDSNPYMTELLGYTRAELAGKHLWEIGLFADREANHAAFRQLKTEGYIRYENLPLKTSQGERRAVEFVSNTYPEGPVEVIQCNIRDITERRKLEEDLAAVGRRDRRIAAAMQRSLLFMPGEDAFPDLQVKMLHEEASEEDLVGGDFWDIFAYDNGHVALVIGDVMGHGLTAAVFTAEIRFILRAFLREHEQPSLVLNQLNAYIFESHRLFQEGLNDEGDDAPICLTLAVLHPASGNGKVACAGMEPPLISRAGGTTDVLEVKGALLGMEPDQEYTTVTFHLEPGDTVLMTTDGITEARRGREFLGIEGLLRLVQEAQSLDTLELTAQSIMAGARAFGNGSFRDDVCLVLARRQ